MEVRAGDLRAAYDLIGELAAVADEAAFWELALPRLLELVPAESATFNVWDYRLHALVEGYGHTDLARDNAAFGAYWHELPWLPHAPADALRQRNRRSSDFVPRRIFKRLEIYDTYYRPLGVEYGLGLGLGVTRAQMRGVVFERLDRDFSEYEVALTQLLTPHLTALHRSLRVRARLAKRLRELEASARERPAPAAEAVGRLTPREAQVLALVAEGLTNPQVAARLYMSPRTVQKHLQHAFEKLGVRTRAAATARYLALVEERTA